MIPTTLYLKVELRIMKGGKRYYPMSPDAKFLLGLMNHKSFTENQLKRCKLYGWIIYIELEDGSEWMY